MRNSQRVPRTGPSLVSLACLLVLTVASGCSEGAEKEYATPHSLCGTAVSPDLIDPLLPTGKELAQEPGGEGIPLKYCHVLVDDKLALAVRHETAKNGETLLPSPRTRGIKSPKESADGKYVLGDNGAVTVLRCGTGAAPEARFSRTVDMFVSVKIGSDITDATAVKEFITAYRATLVKGKPCFNENGAPAPLPPGTD